MKPFPAFFNAFFILFACVFLLSATRPEAQTPEAREERRSAAGHRGKINALARDQDGRIISAGEDGFLGIWDAGAGRAESRFQISEYALPALALRPGRNEAAVIESDRMGLYRVSVWDYIEKRIVFTLRFDDPLLFINYSASGGFLIVSRSARSALIFIHSETGEAFQSPQDLVASVSFAATGKSERTMITYSPAGTLSYWELDSGDEIRRLSVPANLSSPLLFGNNAFFAALEGKELIILDAVSGNEIFRKGGIDHSALFPSEGEDREFIALSSGGTAAELLLYRISAAGLETASRAAIPGNLTASAAIGGIPPYTAALGASDGGLYFVPASGDVLPAAVSSPIAVGEGAVSGGVLAFITRDGFSGFIPLDYSEFADGSLLRLVKEPVYTRVISAPAENVARFLYWQNADARLAPVLKTVSPAYSGAGEYPEFQEQAPLPHLLLPSPVSSASVLGNRALFMDTAGNVQVIALDSPVVEFSFASPGSLDAAFLDERNIILARSAASGNSPFLKVDIVTGETVPLYYDARAGVKVFRDGGGNFYGAVITGDGEDGKTGILRLDTNDSTRSVSVAEYSGENLDFLLAGENGVLVSDLGGDAPTLYNGQEPIRFERGEGFPKRILSGGGFFIIIDSEGSIAWYNGESGKLEALLRIYPDGWVLEKDGETVQGPIAGNR
jgi:hypothetical protein